MECSLAAFWPYDRRAPPGILDDLCHHVGWRQGVERMTRTAAAPRGSAGFDRAATGAPLARLPVLGIAGIVVAGLLALSPQYGFHRDELYFIVAGRHPAFGYADQPPLTPLLSALAAGLLGVTPTAIRILPALAIGACVVLAGLIAADLGGGRRAQLLAAAVVASSGYLAAGHLASTATFDLLAWAVVLWLTMRILAGADPRLWLAVGVVVGVALQNKDIILFLGVALIGGFLFARRWDVLRSPWAWAGLAIAILLWAPNLAWQVANGLPAARDGGPDRRRVGQSRQADPRAAAARRDRSSSRSPSPARGGSCVPPTLDPGAPSATRSRSSLSSSS